MPLVQRHKTSRRALRVSHDDGEIGLSSTSGACTLSTSSSIVEDIDANDAECSKCIVEYVGDVMRDLSLKECEQHAQLCALDAPTTRRREALIVWIDNVRQRSALLLDTMALAVAILDRFASHAFANNGATPFNTEAAAPAPPTEQSLNVLHAAGSLLLAAALEETFAPSLDDMIWACKSPKNRPPIVDTEQCAAFLSVNALTSDALQRMTRYMASTLNFDLWTATWLHFLRRFSRASQHSTSEHAHAKRYCIAALRRYATVVLPHRPSKVAAAAVYCTRAADPERFRRPWSKTLNHFSGYSEEQVADIVQKIAASHTC